MKPRNLSLLIFLALLCVPAVSAQNKKPLTNDDVVQMAKAGFNEATIDQAINANPTAFDTSVQALIALKNDGISQKVIDAMLAAETRKSASDSPEPSREGSARGGSSSGLPAIYVEEISSTGGTVASSDSTLEAIKTLQHKHMCLVTIREKADYILQITRQRGKHAWRKDTKIALSNREGEVVLAKSTRSVGGAMGDVADYVRKHRE